MTFSIWMSRFHFILLVCVCVCVRALIQILTQVTRWKMMANVMHCSANGSGPLGRMDSFGFWLLARRKWIHNDGLASWLRHTWWLAIRFRVSYRQAGGIRAVHSQSCKWHTHAAYAHAKQVWNCRPSKLVLSTSKSWRKKAQIFAWLRLVTNQISALQSLYYRRGIK
jgi:hypothetical protein